MQVKKLPGPRLPGPRPGIDVVDKGPSVTVGMGLLLRHIQALALPIQMVHVGDPAPGRGSLRRHALFTIPHRLLPIRIGLLKGGLSQRLVKIRIDRLALVTRVVAPSCGLVKLVHLHGCIGTPAPQHGRFKLVQVDLIPAGSSRSRLDTQLENLIAELVCKGLASRVVR